MCVDQNAQPVWNVVVDQQDDGKFHDVVKIRDGIVAVGLIDRGFQRPLNDAFLQTIRRFPSFFGSMGRMLPIFSGIIAFF
jgi:hypothetical protein